MVEVGGAIRGTKDAAVELAAAHVTAADDRVSQALHLIARAEERIKASAEKHTEKRNGDGLSSTPGRPFSSAGGLRENGATLELQVAEGFDLVFTQGPATLKGNFDGRDYSTSGPETCRFSKVGDRGFSSTVSINGKPVAVDTFTVSADGQTPDWRCIRATADLHDRVRTATNDG